MAEFMDRYPLNKIDRFDFKFITEESTSTATIFIKIVKGIVQKKFRYLKTRNWFILWLRMLALLSDEVKRKWKDVTGHSGPQLSSFWVDYWIHLSHHFRNDATFICFPATWLCDGDLKSVSCGWTSIHFWN